MTPIQLMNALVDRYNTPPPKKNISRIDFAKFEASVLSKIRLRASQVLKKWIEEHYEDYLNDSQLVDKIEDFVEMMRKTKAEVLGGHVLSALRKQQQARESEDTSSEEKSDSSHQDLSHCDFLLIFSPKQIAEQVTLLESKMFASIKETELLNKSWSKDNREQQAPHIYQMINWFNLFSNFVATRILLEPDVENRQIILEIMISLAYELMSLNNLNGVLEVCSALQSSAIFRLKQTWSRIDPAVMKKFEQMIQLISNDNNFASLRKTVYEVKPPCIPYIGIYLTDLTFIEDGNKDTIGDKINFVKRRKLASVISDLKVFQQTTYSEVETDDMIQSILRDLKTQLPKEEMYVRSLILEPKRC
jgi:son of sevenless-like protein